MNNQDRTIGALLDLIDRLEYDAHCTREKMQQLEQELVAVTESRNEFRNKLYQEWSDDLDGGAHNDMMEEFSACNS